MLSVTTYPRDYFDACRARVDAQLTAYRRLRTAVTDQAALEAFEAVFTSNMVLTLDSYFTHRARALELKDGNPANEVRVLCSSLLQNGGVLAAEKSINLKPEKSVLGYAVGDEIRLSEADFVRLADAYFADIERKYV